MLTVLKHSTLSFKNCHLIAKAANILKPAGDVMVAMSIFHMQSICVLLGFLIHWSDLYAYILTVWLLWSLYWNFWTSGGWVRPVEVCNIYLGNNCWKYCFMM